MVYTKSPKLPESIIPELQAAAKRVNLDFNKFTTTDNTCGPEPPLIARVEKTVMARRPCSAFIYTELHEEICQAGQCKQEHRQGLSETKSSTITKLMFLESLQVEKGEEFVEKELEEGEKFVEEEIEEGENFVVTIAKKLGQAQEALFASLGKGAQQAQLDEERFLQELGDEEKQLLNDLEMNAVDVGKLFGNAIPIRRLR